ncbi:MAG: diguanylate cyclase [Actinobacteria bacterium]|nr:diguanylate cyclase [Actinomycetota bacterium]
MNNLTGINLRSEMLQVFKDNLMYENKESLWNDDTRHFADTVYKGVLSCINDELYLQEFMPFGHIYRVTGEYVAKTRENNIEIEDLMEEHISLRDAFWEVRRNVPDKLHNFDAEKRICQCFNTLLQITIQAYQAEDVEEEILDPLRDADTGVYNSRYFHNRLEEELARSSRHMRLVTIAVFSVNTGFESDSGPYNEVVRAVARALRRNTRTSDVIARLDHEIFSIMLPGTKVEDASTVSVRLKGKVHEYLEELGEEYAKTSIGYGVANYPEVAEESSELIRMAIQKIEEGV